MLALAWGLASPAVGHAIDVIADIGFGLAQRKRDVKSDVGLTTTLTVGPTVRTVTIEPAGAVEAAWQLALKPELRPRRAPVAGQRGYR